MDGYLLFKDLKLVNAKFRSTGLVQMSPASSKGKHLLILDLLLFTPMFILPRKKQLRVHGSSRIAARKTKDFVWHHLIIIIVVL